MEEDQMELTSAQVADAFGVKPVTVSSWVKQRKLRGVMPRMARRLGRRFKIGDVREFAASMGDEGYSERQFEEWFNRNRDAVVIRQPSSVTGTDVLDSRV